ncbi:TPA: tape measure protein [Serratia liquefaciens]|nr:tape measure protein [Serratia liquefaciens]
MATEDAGTISYEVDIETAKMLTGSRKASVVLGEMEKNSKGASRAVDGLSSSADRAGRSMGGFKSVLSGVASAISIALIIDYGKAFLTVADNITQLQSRIARLSTDAAAAKETFATLSSIASTTGASLQDTAKLWETLTSSLKEAGATNGQVLALTDTLQKIGRVGGSSSEEMANALRQFGQSIASGTVRAEEFNSILEQMPELARQIATGLGMSMGELRQSMLEGKLTAQDALNSIMKQSGAVNEEFKKLPRTMDQASNSLTISLQILIGKMNDTVGASTTMVTIIDSISAAIDRLSGKTETAAQKIADLTSTADMYERRARTWSWLGLDGWSEQNKALASLSNRAATLVGDLDEVTKATKKAADQAPIAIPTTPRKNGAGVKAGKSQAQKDADSYARAQESVAQKLDQLRQKSELTASSTLELSKAQAVLNAQLSLGKSATQEQISLAGQYAASAWDTANAVREQAKAEKEKVDVKKSFEALQTKANPSIGLQSSFQKDMADLNAYATLYPQKIAEVEAARAVIEEQYRTQRQAAMWEEWRQQNVATELFATSLESSMSTVSNSITGLITGTQSLNDSLLNIAQTVINSIVNSFVTMGVEWVKSAAIGSAAQISATTATTAASVAGTATTTAASTAAAATTTAAWAPAAVVASIGSFGGAAAIGVGAVIAAMALAGGIAGRRKNGGPVSAGSMYQVGEGGMPEIYQASNGSQYMIPGDNGKVISNKDMQGGGMNVVVNFNDYSSGSHSYDYQVSQSGNTLTVDAFMADMDNGGPMSQSVARNHQAPRRATE